MLRSLVVVVVFGIITVAGIPTARAAGLPMAIANIKNDDKAYICVATQVKETLAIMPAHCLKDGIRTELRLSLSVGAPANIVAKPIAIANDRDLALVKLASVLGKDTPLNAGTPVAGEPVRLAYKPLSFTEFDTAFDDTRIAQVAKTELGFPYFNAFVLDSTSSAVISGAPVLDKDGAILGIIVARAKKKNDLGLKPDQLLAMPLAEAFKVFGELQ